MTRLAVACATLVALLAVAGCTEKDEPEARTYREMGFDGQDWPDLHGAKVVILDHGAFEYLFNASKPLFEALTNGTVEHVAARDAGDALNRAIREKDNPSFDVVWGLDNALLGKAVREGALQPYTPVLAPRVNETFVFFGNQTPWPATPVDHGYIAVNYDARTNYTLETLYDLRTHADQFVTQDPRTSSPGLGFLLATIYSLPEGPGLYDWKDYWRELFEEGLLVTPDWTTAYVTHFTGGYGQGGPGFRDDREIVTSYTTSPAYEFYFGNEELNALLLADGSVFHQIETVALAAKPDSLAAAQAWIEFTLTDQFQDLHAANNAVYPVVDGIDVEPTFLELDPPPVELVPADLSYAEITANIDLWLADWTEVYEEFQATA